MSLINITNLTFAYEDGYDNVFENVSFQLDTDWKLGFTGRNGRGKTTFLKLLMGKYEYRGSISASVDFEYFPYEIKDQSLNGLEIAEEMCPALQYWQIVKELNILEADEGILYRPFSTMSGGERAKLLLAAMFLKENSFLLIDEPTNHLDIRGREVVSRYLNGKKSFILVSHDRVFLDGCVDHILSINKADIEIIKGSFSVWLENKERRDSFELAENSKLKKEIKQLETAAKEKRFWSDRAESGKIGIDPLHPSGVVFLICFPVICFLKTHNSIESGFSQSVIVCRLHRLNLDCEVMEIGSAAVQDFFKIFHSA